MPPVPNTFPSLPSRYRIALVAEAPGETEEHTRVPLTGASGHLLNRILREVGLNRDELFVGNVCQLRPRGNDFAQFAWTDDEVQSGIRQLLLDLASYRPWLVVTLGNVPLHVFRHGNVAPPRTKTGYQWPSKVTSWRGSLWLADGSVMDATTPAARLLSSPSCSSPAPGASLVVPSQGGEGEVSLRDTTGATGPLPPPLKCLSTLHPAFCVRVYSACFDLRQDLRRAREEGDRPELVLPETRIECGPVEGGNP